MEHSPVLAGEAGQRDALREAKPSEGCIASRPWAISRRLLQRLQSQSNCAVVPLTVAAAAAAATPRTALDMHASPCPAPQTTLETHPEWQTSSRARHTAAARMVVALAKPVTSVQALAQVHGFPWRAGFGRV